MNRRIARKILNRYGFHWGWYYNGSVYSKVPKHTALYFKANRAMKIRPYYDAEWLRLINKRYGIQDYLYSAMRKAKRI